MITVNKSWQLAPRVGDLVVGPTGLTREVIRVTDNGMVVAPLYQDLCAYWKGVYQSQARQIVWSWEMHEWRPA